MFADWPLLSLAIWTPIMGGAIILAICANNSTLAKQLSLVVSIITFIIAIPLYTQFNADTAIMQFEENIPLITT